MSKKNSARIRQQDIKEFNRKMKKFEKFTMPNKGLDQELQITANQIGDISTDNVPVISGKLRDSIRFESKFLDYIVKYIINYASFVEFGRPGKGSIQGHKPFFRPAITQAKINFVKRIKSKLKELVK
tara:strand:- start:443 stop:823 length:381 start_codon:yes stop_codon:yes gene_type:complete